MKITFNWRCKAHFFCLIEPPEPKNNNQQENDANHDDGSPLSPEKFCVQPMCPLLVDSRLKQQLLRLACYRCRKSKCGVRRSFQTMRQQASKQMCTVDLLTTRENLLNVAGDDLMHFTELLRHTIEITVRLGVKIELLCLLNECVWIRCNRTKG